MGKFADLILYLSFENPGVLKCPPGQISKIHFNFNTVARGWQ